MDTTLRKNETLMPTSFPFNRVLLIVLDGAGIGAMPDAPEWGDAGADTFGHILESRPVRLPNLQRYGLGNIRPLESVPVRSSRPPTAITIKTCGTGAPVSSRHTRPLSVFPESPAGAAGKDTEAMHADRGVSPCTAERAAPQPVAGPIRATMRTQREFIAAA